MIPKRIHQIWIGEEPLPAQYQEWHNKLKELHPGWEVTLWGDELWWEDFGRYATEQGWPRWKVNQFFWSYASMSNMLRLLLIKRYGGIYLDVDFEPIKPLDSLTGYDAFAAEQDTGRICNAIFGAIPNHPWVDFQINRGSGTCDSHDAAWGVYTMTEAPRDGVTIIPSHLVYPWPYGAKEKNLHNETLVAHHWAGTWVK